MSGIAIFVLIWLAFMGVARDEWFSAIILSVALGHAGFFQ